MPKPTNNHRLCAKATIHECLIFFQTWAEEKSISLKNKCPQIIRQTDRLLSTRSHSPTSMTNLTNWPLVRNKPRPHLPTNIANSTHWPQVQNEPTNMTIDKVNWTDHRSKTSPQMPDFYYQTWAAERIIARIKNDVSNLVPSLKNPLLQGRKEEIKKSHSTPFTFPWVRIRWWQRWKSATNFCPNR